MILVYTPCTDKEEAHNIAEALLNDKLIACANIFPIKSLYWWKGDLQEDNEVVLLVKTTDKLWEKVKKKIIGMHSYECPCVMKIKVEANKEYEGWVRKQVK